MCSDIPEHVEEWHIGLSLLCSNIALLFYSGILACYCYYSHASLAICSNYARLIIDKHLKLEEGQMSLPLVPVTRLSPLSILTAFISDQNVTVPMLVAV